MHDLAPGSQNTPTGAAPVSVHFVNNVLAAAASYIEDEPDYARDVLAELGRSCPIVCARPARFVPLAPGARPRRRATCASSRRDSRTASRPSCPRRRELPRARVRPGRGAGAARRRARRAGSASAAAACASRCAPAWTATALEAQLDEPRGPGETPSGSRIALRHGDAGARHERDATASPSSRSTTSRGRWRTSSACSRRRRRSTASRRRRRRRRRSSTCSGGRYDALLLDVQMPEIEGMALARLLRRFADPPAVVFVTGHPDAAVEAFEIQALDFLVKPVSRERLESALGRVEAQSRPAPRRRRPRTARRRRPRALGPGRTSSRVDNPKGGGKRLVRLETISIAQANGDYARIVCDDGRFLLRTPLEPAREGLGAERASRGSTARTSSTSRHAVELRAQLNGTAVLDHARRDRGAGRAAQRRRAAAAPARLTRPAGRHPRGRAARPAPRDVPVMSPACGLRRTICQAMTSISPANASCTTRSGTTLTIATPAIAPGTAAAPRSPPSRPPRCRSGAAATRRPAPSA